MSNTEQHITVDSVAASTATLGALTSQSITNSNIITTDALTTGVAQISNTLVVNGNAQVHGVLKIDGNVSFGDVAYIRDDNNFLIKGTLTTTKGAFFGNNNVIGTDRFLNSTGTSSIIEGLISSNNLRASNRLFVGDSDLEVNANTKQFLADTFNATFASIVAEYARISRSDLQYTEIDEAVIDEAKVATLTVNQKLIAAQIEAQDFTAVANFGVNDLAVAGSIDVKGGIVIRGSNGVGGGLLVDAYRAVFNKGIEVNGKEGAVVATLSVVGTSDTTGDDGLEGSKFAFNTAIGIRSKFQGEVVVQDTQMTMDNSTLNAHEIILSNAEVSRDSNVNELQILDNGNGFDTYAASQMTYISQPEEAQDETAGTSVEAMVARFNVPYEGKAIDITSPRDALAKARENAKKRSSEKKARAISVASMTKAFNIKNNARYRIDANGNMLVKNAIIENIQTNKITANEIVADNFRTNNFQMENVVVDGVLNAQTGASLNGVTEVNGDVFNYANVSSKGAVTRFTEQSLVKFENDTTLKVCDQAVFETDDQAVVSLHGKIELDVSKLILFNSTTGKRYSLIVRDAVEQEGDDPGDIALEVSELSEEEVQPVATTLADATRTTVRLRSDLEDFQEKLRRI